MRPLVNIIGAGKLGKTIGHLLVKNKLVTMGVICNRSLESAIAAVEFIGEGSYCASISELPAADINFITTPDDSIRISCEALSKNKQINQEGIIVHCSGSLTSDALISIKERGGYVASIHPMRSIVKPELSVVQFKGTYCAIEGDQEALVKVSSLFNSIGAVTYKIDKQKKSLYHAAGVFASNYLITLSQQALSCLSQAGVENELAMQIITAIMRNTVSNLEKTLSPEQALSGPIQRGDRGTIEQHMSSFSDPIQKKLYADLGKATLRLTAHEKNVSQAIEEAFRVEA